MGAGDLHSGGIPEYPWSTCCSPRDGIFLLPCVGCLLCVVLLGQTQSEAWPRSHHNPFGALERGKVWYQPSLIAPFLPAHPPSNPDTSATKKMISVTLTDHFEGIKKQQKSRALKIGVFRLCKRSLDQPGQAPSVRCVSRTWICLIKDHSSIKVIRAIFLERLFPCSIICNVFFKSLLFLLCVRKTSSVVVVKSRDSCPSA